MFIVFDLLVDDRGKSLLDTPLFDRRGALEAFAKPFLSRCKAIQLCPSTPDVRTARSWLAIAGRDLDGVIAKPLDRDYRGCGMLKVKPRHTVDCVVGGFQCGGGKSGSLLLGLFNDRGRLDFIGQTGRVRFDGKDHLGEALHSIVSPPGFTGRKPGWSRFESERVADWSPVAPRLIAEVEYMHFTGGRFRTRAGFVRWRFDQEPAECTYATLSHSMG